MSKLFALIVIVLGVIAIAQLVRLYEEASKLRNRGEHEISTRDNRLNAKLMLVFMVAFFAFCAYLFIHYGWTGRGGAATEHGKRLDWLLNINLWIICTVFFVTNFLLFLFAYKYVKKPGVAALYFPHNNVLELIWTVIPAMSLLVIIVLGLIEWNKATSKAGDDAIVIELFSKQFDWTARYAGADNKLGKHDYKLTTDKNMLAIANTETIDYAIDKMMNDSLLGMKAVERKLNDRSIMMIPSDRVALQNSLKRNEEIYRLLVQMRNRHDASLDAQSWDDVIIAGPAEKLYLAKGQEFELLFRSKDVIHSALFPHFRIQMNTLPGSTTRFKLTPDKTTAEMRKEKNDPKFDYVLMCNKICGGSHYKMYMIVEILEKEEYNAVMKAFDLGGDNSTRPANDQLSDKELKLVQKVLGETPPAPHRFETMFKGAPAAPAAEKVEAIVEEAPAA